MCKLGREAHLSLSLSVSLAGFLLSCHVSRLRSAAASARETEPHQEIVSFSDSEDVCFLAIVLASVE